MRSLSEETHLDFREPQPRTLDDILHVTDKELERITDTTGIPVVPHEWYLTPTNRHCDDQAALDARTRYQNIQEGRQGVGQRLLPQGYLLVAKVASVRNVPQTHQQRIPYDYDPLLSYRNSTKKGDIYLWDTGIDQCVQIKKHDPDSTTIFNPENYVFVDVEPYLARKLQ